MSRTRTFALTLLSAAVMSGAALAQQSGGRGGGDVGGGPGGGGDPGNAISVLIKATAPGGPSNERRPARQKDSNRPDCFQNMQRGNYSDGGQTNQLCHIQ